MSVSPASVLSFGRFGSAIARTLAGRGMRMNTLILALAALYGCGGAGTSAAPWSSEAGIAGDGSTVGASTSSPEGRGVPPRADQDDYVTKARELLSGMRSDGSGPSPIDFERALRLIYRSPNIDTPYVRRLREKVERFTDSATVERARKDAWDTVQPVSGQLIGPAGGVLNWMMVGTHRDNLPARKWLDCHAGPASMCWLTLSDPLISSKDFHAGFSVRFLQVDNQTLVTQLEVPSDLPAGTYRVDLEDTIGGTICLLDECRIWFQKSPPPGLPVFTMEFPRGEPTDVESGATFLTEDAKKILDTFRRKMRDEAQCRVQIRGSADSIGSDVSNLNLAGRRALTLRNLILTGLSSSERLEQSTRMRIESLGERPHRDLGINGEDDDLARVATARLVTEDGSDCQSLGPVRLPLDADSPPAAVVTQ